MPTIVPIIGGGGTYTRVVREYTSSGTWTKPAGLIFLEVICIGGGGGGASGSRTASGVVSRAGCGGCAGSIAWSKLLASDLSSQESFTIGSGGSGGASVTTDDTNGSNGNAGGDTFFSGTNYETSKVYASGGGTSSISTSNSRTFSSCKPTNTCKPGLAGAISGSTGLTVPAAPAENTTTAFNLNHGGGAGGGIRTSNVAGSGSAGSRIYSQSMILSADQTGYSVNGVNYYSSRFPMIFSNSSYLTFTLGRGTSGGGGNGHLTTPWNGGNGGNGGGAGGGGGSTRNGYNSGAGGNGGAGCIILIEHIIS